MLAFEFTFGHVGSQVVVSEEYDIAQLHFDIKKAISLKQSRRSNSCHYSMEVLFFLYVCPQVMLLDKTDFALSAKLVLIGRDTYEGFLENFTKTIQLRK